MEKKFKIKTSDGHLIYGTLNTPIKKTERLIVFIHGLTGHQDEHIFWNAARFFPKRKISIFRFDLYSGERKGRKLSQCTVKLHAEDLNQVIYYFRSQYKKIYLVGHSLGGPTVLMSDTQKINGIVLWDSSDYHIYKRLQRILQYEKNIKKYVINWGIEALLGKQMIEEFKHFPTSKELMSRISVPIKIISAGKGALKAVGREYFKYAKQPKKFTIIKGAGHNFNEDGTSEKLFQETLEWVRRF